MRQLRCALAVAFGSMYALAAQGEPSMPTGAELAALHSTCLFDAAGTALSLSEAIERAICSNPHSRKAWATAVAQLDQLGVAQAAYLPNLSAVGTLGKAHDITDTSATAFDSDIASRSQGATLNLSLTLLDFGKRDANVERSRQLLAAANESREVAVIQVFLDTAQAYYDTLDAAAVLEASQRAEAVSNESLRVASARNAGGTAALTDQLQAETAYLQDKAKRLSAQSDLATAHGNLAVAAGLDPNAPFELSTVLAESPAALSLDPPEKLIAAAKAGNPKVAAARANHMAANAAIDAAIARRFPTISLQASYNATDRRLNPSANTFGITDIPTNSSQRGANVQLRLTMPLFDGFSTTHSIHEARAQAEAVRTDLDAAEQELTLDVWKAYQQVLAQSQSIEVTKEIVRVAQESLSASETRYRLGSGNIVDVLNAQTALAMAERQRIDALANWRTARLRLVASLGNIGMWAIE